MVAMPIRFEIKSILMTAPFFQAFSFLNFMFFHIDTFLKYHDYKATREA